MAALTFYAFDNVKVTAYFLAGLIASFVVLLGLARLIIRGAERLPRSRSNHNGQCHNPYQLSAAQQSRKAAALKHGT